MYKNSIKIILNVLFFILLIWLIWFMFFFKKDSEWNKITPRLSDYGEVEYVQEINFNNCLYRRFENSMKIDCGAYGQDEVQDSNHDILVPSLEDGYQGDINEKVFWKDSDRLNLIILEQYE